MGDELGTKRERKVSPGMIVFLVFPMLGLIAALVTALSSVNTPRDNRTPMTPPGSIPQMNYNAPNMTLTALDGTLMQIIDFRGRIVFLNFWATWCVPCVRELPALSAFAQEQDPETGALVVGINAGETPEVINAYFDDHNISGITVLLDPAGAARSLYGVINLPVTFVIDPEGLVRFMKIGEMTREDMNGYMEELLARG
jgi:thiol-disulfide isomerase/thioredoxin